MAKADRLTHCLRCARTFLLSHSQTYAATAVRCPHCGSHDRSGPRRLALAAPSATAWPLNTHSAPPH